MKVAVIGGGSSYTPELVEGLLTGDPEVAEIALMDIAEDKLAIVGGLAQRMALAAGGTTRVSLTTDRAQALEGADIVVTQFRVGGLDARIRDERIPMTYNLIGQETTGVGGMFKALRTIPVMLEIKAEMAQRCPQAWLLNFTNPSGLVCEALRLARHERYIGLCNYPLTVKMKAAAALGVAEKRVELDYFGLNHLSWCRVLLDGKDITADLLQIMINNSEYHELSGYHFPAEKLLEWQLIPSGYLRYYCYQQQMVREQQQAECTRGEKVQQLEATLLAEYADESLQQKPAALQERGGAWYSTAALRIMRDLGNESGGEHVINVENQQAIAQLPPDCIVEVPALVSCNGAKSVPHIINRNGKMRGGFQPAIDIIELMQRVKEYEITAASAAIAGSRELAAAALRLHPMFDEHQQVISALLDDMFDAHCEYLPGFF